MGVSKNSGTPKWMVIMEKPIKMDDLGVPLFLETSISTNNTPFTAACLGPLGVFHLEWPTRTFTQTYISDEGTFRQMHHQNHMVSPFHLPGEDDCSRVIFLFFHTSALFFNPLRWGVSQVCCVCVCIHILYIYIYFQYKFPDVGSTWSKTSG